MSMTDPLGDMLTRIRNAQRAKKNEVVSPASRLRENVLEVLKKEGYINGYERVNVKPGIDELRIQFKYHEGISIISTPAGVMSDHEARKANVGGEILCQVF